MSNITFDVKCVRADPQSGICESMAGGGGGTTDVESGTYTPTITMFGPFPITPTSANIPIIAPFPFQYTRIGNIVNVSGVFIHSSTSISGPGEYRFMISYPPITGLFTVSTGFGEWRNNASFNQLPVWLGDLLSTTTAIGYVILNIANNVDGGISISFSFNRV